MRHKYLKTLFRNKAAAFSTQLVSVVVFGIRLYFRRSAIPFRGSFRGEKKMFSGGSFIEALAWQTMRREFGFTAIFLRRPVETKTLLALIISIQLVPLKFLGKFLRNFPAFGRMNPPSIARLVPSTITCPPDMPGNSGLVVNLQMGLRGCIGIAPALACTAREIRKSGESFPFRAQGTLGKKTISTALLWILQESASELFLCFARSSTALHSMIE